MRDRDWRHAVVGLVVLVASLGGAAAASAAPGDLDTSYGHNGAAVVDFGVRAVANALAVQSDGKAIAVGNTVVATAAQTEAARLTTQGQPDPSYGNGGKTQFGPTALDENASAATLQNDGKLLIGGDAALTTPGSSRDVLLGRLNTDGTPDASFGPAGGNGLETLNLGADEFVRGMTLRANGQIVLGGYQVTGSTFEQMVVQVNNPAGGPDTSFWKNGVFVDPFPQSTAYGVAVDPNDGVVHTAAEAFATIGGPTDIDETSIGASGSGTHPVDLGGSEHASAVAVLPSGAYLVAGETDAHGTADFMVHSVGQSGSFGTDDTAIIDLGGSDSAAAMVVQPDGKIILAGNTSSGGTTQIAVLRLQPNGQLDTTFGHNGSSIINLSAIGSPSASSVGLAPDGSILVGGSIKPVGPGTHQEFLVIRLHGDSGGASGGGGGTGGGGGGAGSGGGGGGTAVPRCHGQKATIIGTNGKNKLKGTRKRDVIVGLGGGDTIAGGGGNDLICAGAGRDRVSGGPGNDTIDGGAGADKLAGQAGNDHIAGGPGNDTLSGGAGKDALAGGPGGDALFGGAGKDALAGGPGPDTLNGGPGKDTLAGGPGRNHDRQ